MYLYRIGLFLVAILVLPAQAATSPVNPQVEFQTNIGSFVVELYPDKAPKTVSHFLEHIRTNYYQGTVFHRTVDRFIVQGGGFTADMKEKPFASQDTGLIGAIKGDMVLTKLPNESNNGLKNQRGTLAMARSFQPDSATTQFFINLDDNKFLNFHKPDPHYIGYAVFGKVIRGFDVVKKIGQAPTQTVGVHKDVPVQPIVIEKAALLETPVTAEPEVLPNSLPKSESLKTATKGKKRG
ncbi:MAG TPA: peptidylprolyl isomerase [Methylophilaceae bacterium]|nr:peptidylprolyl isomerase [Methylophilaceae bacterium]